LYISLSPSNRSCSQFLSLSLWFTSGPCPIPHSSAHTPCERVTLLSPARRASSASSASSLFLSSPRHGICHSLAAASLSVLGCEWYPPCSHRSCHRHTTVSVLSTRLRANRSPLRLPPARRYAACQLAAVPVARLPLCRSPTHRCVCLLLADTSGVCSRLRLSHAHRYAGCLLAALPVARSPLCLSPACRCVSRPLAAAPLPARTRTRSCRPRGAPTAHRCSRPGLLAGRLPGSRLCPRPGCPPCSRPGSPCPRLLAVLWLRTPDASPSSVPDCSARRTHPPSVLDCRTHRSVACFLSPVAVRTGHSPILGPGLPCALFDHRFPVPCCVPDSRSCP
jgi:hypothetical protein